MKLHLGCGDKILDGYINIDIRENLNCDLVCDIKTLDTFDTNVADEIYACHVLEHFGRHEYMKILKRWYEVLKPGGTFKLAVPNFESVVHQYMNGENLKTLWGLLYGGQTYELNYHFIIFDYSTLKNDLESIGFVDIDLWDWRTTTHSNVDDFSQCYLPHMDKTNGRLMSLNLIAYK